METDQTLPTAWPKNPEEVYELLLKIFLNCPASRTVSRSSQAPSEGSRSIQVKQHTFTLEVTEIKKARYRVPAIYHRVGDENREKLEVKKYVMVGSPPPFEPCRKNDGYKPIPTTPQSHRRFSFEVKAKRPETEYGEKNEIS